MRIGRLLDGGELARGGWADIDAQFLVNGKGRLVAGPVAHPIGRVVILIVDAFAQQVALEEGLHRLVYVTRFEGPGIGYLPATRGALKVRGDDIPDFFGGVIGECCHYLVLVSRVGKIGSGDLVGGENFGRKDQSTGRCEYRGGFIDGDVYPY
ncbi:hypothetical protein D3C84_611730 [compost metagenome]